MDQLVDCGDPSDAIVSGTASQLLAVEKMPLSYPGSWEGSKAFNRNNTNMCCRRMVSYHRGTFHSTIYWRTECHSMFGSCMFPLKANYVPLKANYEPKNHLNPAMEETCPPPETSKAHPHFWFPNPSI